MARERPNVRTPVSTVALILLGLALWLLLLLVVVVVLVANSRSARSDRHEEADALMGERRRGADRRTGQPDTRPVRVERRRGDRRRPHVIA